MKIKIKMTKRLMVVICIIVAAVSFMGGMIYKYEDYIPIVEYDYEKSKYTYDFPFPIDYEAASRWLDWVVQFHWDWIESGEVAGFEEGMPLEFHQASIEMYVKIKNLFLEFDEEWSNE